MSLMLPLVIGTTGWYDHRQEIEQEVQKTNASILWASNFSLGVNILFQFNKKLAEVMSRFPEYRPHIHEIHHIQKLDAPSGTAMSIAEGIIHEYQDIDSWELQENGRAFPPNYLHESWRDYLYWDSELENYIPTFRFLSLSVFNCPQAARISRPRGRRMGLAKPASFRISAKR